MKCKKLRKIISQEGLRIKELSQKTGIRRFVLYIRLMGLSEFKAHEILLISRALSLSYSQTEDIFFSPKSFLKETKGG
ncbi:MAG: hypothetical protein Q4A86_02615 [Clostridia bacterium]|nr:hypothetical protein [Clostridia bacterium]